jgi:osmoprotectant transport system substrate-binding protein
MEAQMPRPTTLLAAAALTLVGSASGLVATTAASAAPAKVAATEAAMVTPTIVIGSENFPEEEVLGNLYADVLQHAGYKTDLRSDLGTRQYVENALAHKALDLFPDYAGSLLVFLKPGDTVQAGQLSTDIPALKGALAPAGATVLNPAPALDTNVFAVTKATAAKYHLKTLSDLTAVASQLVFAAPPECPQNYFCLPGLEKVYGLHFKQVISADDAGPITVADLSNGKAQVAELFSTDGAIASNGFVQLADNKHLEPADHVIPVIRSSFDTPGVAKAINALSAKLTQEQLLNLDNEVNVNHNPATTATSWLKSVGLT